MLFSTTSLLSAPRTKTIQTPRKGEKVIAQSSAKKNQQTTKQPPRVEKQLSEEERIIQAAERYHQQISGKLL